MRKMRTILAAGLAVLALSAAAALPAVAMADTADSTGTVVATTTPPPSVPATFPMIAHPSKKAIVEYRVKARVRLAAFNHDASVLRRRINRLGFIATLVHKAGGDVTHVREELKSARDYLAVSQQQAKIAAAELRLVPYFVNRKAALARANAEFKTARGSLRSARSWKQAAASDLWKLVKQYAQQSKVSAKDFA
ncbi:MAG: hypothetical protein P4L93_11675 [Coriobacteriia bacterium]|nr:hypothetical protein [Coriobacteriia bacterium]